MHSVYVQQGDRYSTFLHDTVILYAIALNETLRKGEDVNSGSVIFRNCIGKMFRGQYYNASALATVTNVSFHFSEVKVKVQGQNRCAESHL